MCVLIWCLSMGGGQYACMPVRKVVTGKWVCHTDDDCLAHTHAASVCVTPSLENQTRFIRVVHLPNMHMLFVGYPPHLQYAGTVSHAALLVRCTSEAGAEAGISSPLA